MGALMFFLLDSGGLQARLDVPPEQPIEESRRSWGEGSASAWQSLQRFEQWRQAVQPRG